MNEKTQIEVASLDENDHEFIQTPKGKQILFAGAFIIIFITLHFLLPIFSRLEWQIIPESIRLFNLIPVNGNYFFGFLFSVLTAFLLAYHMALLKKIVKVLGLFLVSFLILFITLQFLLPGIPTGPLDIFPEIVNVFGITIRSSHFFALIISVVLAILLIFYPEKFKTMIKFIFSFWGFKAALSIVDILIFRNLLRASDADNFTMWTIPLLFAFLTNFLPFFFAVVFKTHQEGFEDKQEAGRNKKASLLRQRISHGEKISHIQVKEDNRMRNASRIFLWTAAVLILATAGLVTNQRWLQMNQSLHRSLAHFEEMGPHTILVEGTQFYIENPPLDELPPFAVMQDFWHLNDIGQPVYGHYQQFLIDFTLLILPILLIFVTMLASYFNASTKITNKWYQMLEELTDRKKKKMRMALQEYEEAKTQYETSKFEYEQAVFKRSNQMKNLQVLIGANTENISDDVTIFESACREMIRENSLLTTLNAYDAHLNNLHGWLLNDLEIFKSKMATHHEEVAVQHTVLTIDLHTLISGYNKTVEPIKQFDTAEKTEALMARLKMMNKCNEIGAQENE